MYKFIDGLWQSFEDLAGIEAAIIYYRHKKTPIIFIDFEYEHEPEIQEFIRTELKRRLKDKLLKNNWISYGWLEIDMLVSELDILLERSRFYG
jgi:hypothetical protein